jgi:hypothetical protein
MAIPLRWKVMAVAAQSLQRQQPATGRHNQFD